MIAILSPAKNLNELNQGRDIPTTVPVFASDANKMAHQLRGIGADDLARLMKISKPLAELNATRYLLWQQVNNQPLGKPSILTFNGEVYRGLDAATLSVDDLNFANSSLLILSGLYGVLKPFDAIQPYRLEMGTKWAPGKFPNLYQYWGNRITNHLKETVKNSQGEKVLINLASVEYSKSVDFKKLGFPSITIDFKEDRPSGPVNIAVYAKRARGLMARYIVQNRIMDTESLKSFDSEGYYYDSHRSTHGKWLFIR
jgi:hypothetical protein